LSRFVDKLKAEGHETIIIDPDPDNVRAVRAYSKAGFRPVPYLTESAQGVLIMQHESSTNEINP
jgi:RimJ/RimL family protein N-acetyltransferase